MYRVKSLWSAVVIRKWLSAASTFVTLPVAGNYAIVDAKMWPYLDQFFKGDLNAKDAMAKAMKDSKDEIAKQKK